jgi:LacI family transcriptional regulator
MRKVALFMGLSDFYEHGIARGVVRYARSRQDWRIFGFGWMFSRLEDISSWKGDGVIARVEDAASADRLAALRIPVVDVAGGYDRPRFAKVTNDDFLTGYNAALHLLGCGLSRFAFLGVSGTRWSSLRREGFERAVAERAGSGGRAGHEAPRTPLPAFERPLSWWESWGEEEGEAGKDGGALGAFLSALRRPFGLFACNDTTGLRAAEIAGRLRIPVPESMAVLGVDNEDILCELASPGLSSIMLDCEAIGFRAARALDEAVEGGARGGEVVAVPPKEVVERASTRVCACDDELVARAATFIRAEAQEGIDVSDVLGVVPASRRTLEKRFKAALGISVHDEIVRVRLAKAKRLLRETESTIEAVAAESGFGTAQRFYEVFRSREGVPPGQWRRAAGRDGP